MTETILRHAFGSACQALGAGAIPGPASPRLRTPATFFRGAAFLYRPALPNENARPRDVRAAAGVATFAASACLLLTFLLPLGGCSVSMPIASLAPSKEDATGAIPESALVRLLEPEDWRRAKAALSTALDPQGNGLPVSWDNPGSGVRGSFTPLGKVYPSEARICRAFIARVDSKGDEHAMRGSACSAQGGDWIVTDLKTQKI